MRKYFDLENDYSIICDTCEQNLDMYDIKLMKPPIKLNYYSTDYDFCNYKCLLTFVIQEINKENPRNDIITGGKE